jgi:hypothetical protein
MTTPIFVACMKLEELLQIEIGKKGRYVFLSSLTLSLLDQILSSSLPELKNVVERLLFLRLRYPGMLRIEGSRNPSLFLSETEKHLISISPLALPNPGINSCWMNSILQALFNIEPLRDVYLEYSWMDGTPNLDSPATSQYIQTYAPKRVDACLEAQRIHTGIHKLFVLMVKIMVEKDFKIQEREKTRFANYQRLITNNYEPFAQRDIKDVLDFIFTNLDEYSDVNEASNLGANDPVTGLLFHPAIYNIYQELFGMSIFEKAEGLPELEHRRFFLHVRPRPTYVLASALANFESRPLSEPFDLEATFVHPTIPYVCDLAPRYLYLSLSRSGDQPFGIPVKVENKWLLISVGIREGNYNDIESYNRLVSPASSRDFNQEELELQQLLRDQLGFEMEESEEFILAQALKASLEPSLLGTVGHFSVYVYRERRGWFYCNDSSISLVHPSFDTDISIQSKAVFLIYKNLARLKK